VNQLAFDFATAAFSEYDEDGFLVIAHDSIGDPEKAGVVPCESQPGVGATLLQVMNGDETHHIPLTDPRDAKKRPKLRKGGAQMYGGAGEYRSFVLIDGDDPNGVQKPGSLTTSVAYAKAGAKKSLVLSFDVRTPGKESIALVHGEGQRISMLGEGKRAITLTSADGSSYMECSDQGNVLGGKTKVQGSLTVGSQAAATELVLLQPLFAYLQALEAKLAASPVGAVAVPVASVFATLGTKHLKAT
jgi:hypothetical protein